VVFNRGAEAEASLSDYSCPYLCNSNALSYRIQNSIKLKCGFMKLLKKLFSLLEHDVLLITAPKKITRRYICIKISTSHIFLSDKAKEKTN